MPKEYELVLAPREGFDAAMIEDAVRRKWGRNTEELRWQLLRRSIDARKKNPVIRLRIRIYRPGEKLIPLKASLNYDSVHEAEAVHIIGAGPAGLFAALRLIEEGLRPVIYERGKDVRSRRRDLAALNKEHIVNPESNYCFGEGGAGTYSDGKLYTRSKKRGDVKRILDVLIAHGADEDIRIDAHPHIGTNKLPGIIQHMRQTILDSGGEIYFGHKLTDLEIKDASLSKIELNGHEWKDCNNLILATGHSARDIFELLHKKSIQIEFKPFALGVRVEHPQAIIDQAQYHCDSRGEYLPPASYNLVSQVNDKGVYSFCMCPGGIIAPCATAPEEVVTNGWSPSKRNNPWANSGIVTEVNEEEVAGFSEFGPLRGLEFQKMIERKCWEAAGKTQKVPAQRVLDFIHGRLSEDLPNCSYQPGLTSCRLDEVLPDFVVNRLRQAFKDFGKKMKNYLHKDAVIVAPESRTSSPVRIPRDRESFEHPDIFGLYPCGEGAGYAGGIVSAAMDGEKVALSIAKKVKERST